MRSNQGSYNQDSYNQDSYNQDSYKGLQGVTGGYKGLQGGSFSSDFQTLIKH